MVVEQGCTAESHTTTKCGNGLSTAGPLLPTSSPGTGPVSPSPASLQAPLLSTEQQQSHHYYNHYPHHHHRYSTSSPAYNAEHARMEAWMDENPEFMQDYIIRKATRHVVDAWLVNHATPSSSSNDLLSSPTATHYVGGCAGGGAGSGATTTMVTPVNGGSSCCGGGSSIMAANANTCSSRGGSGATTPVR